MPTRRQFLATHLAAFAAARAARAARPPRILLRSSWQSVNIGDVGHTPGALSLLEKYLPEAEVTLWPGTLGHGSRELLTKGYPRLRIAEGSLGKDGKPGTPALAKAWEEADLYLSGSGSGFPASNHAVAFRKLTGKPVGVFGVSTDPISGIGGSRDPEGGTLESIRARAAKLPPDHLAADLRYVIDRAAFFFCRDTISRDYLKSQQVKTPILEFGPDAQLGMHLRDDAKGYAYLAAKGLQEGKFLCVVPRLRYTPYYRIKNIARVPSDDIKDAINNRTTEKDHAKLREMIIRYVKATGGKVLACPEMTYQIELAKEAVIDPLPADVKKNVVWRDTYWMPDEAASVYSKALAVVSIECHSPLIALRSGVPALHVRQPTDTCKGQMYRDIGAGDWFFEIDETSGEQLWGRIAKIHRDRAKAKAKVKSIMAFVETRQKRMVDAVREACRMT
jgi:polysaccharide pyruvyl transferase WcaK-like protein